MKDRGLRPLNSGCFFDAPCGKTDIERRLMKRIFPDAKSAKLLQMVF